MGFLDIWSTGLVRVWRKDRGPEHGLAYLAGSVGLYFLDTYSFSHSPSLAFIFFLISVFVMSFYFLG